MNSHRQYKVTDYRFGILLVTLRERARVTQKKIAEALKVSSRTIQHWEAGTAFPDTNHLKDLITFLVSFDAFNEGNEKEEIRELWNQADESAARRRTPFDEHWVDGLLLEISKTKTTHTHPVNDFHNLQTNIDWGNAPDIRNIFGRDEELANLTKWTIDQNVRFTVILGMGGIGKTTLLTKFAQITSSNFEYIIWRSLQNAPTLDDFLSDCIQFLSSKNISKPKISDLLHLLKKHRCLIVLDNMETLHKSENLVGEYLDGYKDYKEFFFQLAQTQHKSSVILTSRQIPIELEALEGEDTAVRILNLKGLNWQASQAMLEDRGLFGTVNAWNVLVHYYGGNPLALKLAANTIREIFGGDLSAFLKEVPVTLQNLHYLIESQFDQLSQIEKDIMILLAIKREAASLNDLFDTNSSHVQKQAILAGLMSLRQRSLIERMDTGAVFSLLPVLMEYVTNTIVRICSEEIENLNHSFLKKYPLMNSNEKEYIRESQNRLILSPILNQLINRLDGKEKVSTHFHEMLNFLRKEPYEKHGYAGGNLINLLVAVNGNIQGCDFSDLRLQQIYLQGIDAQDSNFANVEFIEPHFSETIETIGAIALSSSGKLIAASSYSGQIHVWSTEDLKPLLLLSGTQRSWTLMFSPDEKILVSGGFTGEIVLWDTTTGEMLNQVDGHNAWVHALAYQSDNQKIATGGYYGSIRIWRADDMSLLKELEGHTSSVVSISFTPDGSKLVSSSRDGMIKIWDLTSGQCVNNFPHAQKETIVKTCLHPAGKIIASCSEDDSKIKFWDIDSGININSFEMNASGSGAISFDPEGETLAYGTSDGGLGWIDVNPMTNQEITLIRKMMGHEHHVEIVSAASHGLLASFSYGEGIKLWNVATGKLLKTIKGYSRLIGASDFSLDGKFLIQGDANGMIRVWNMEKKAYEITFQAHAGPIWRIAMNPTGKNFATCSDDRSIKLWSLSDFQCEKTLPGHVGRLYEITFSNDGKYIASAGADKYVMVWNTKSGVRKNVLTIENESGNVWTLAFNPDNTLLASGYDNGQIILWNIDEGKVHSILNETINSWGNLVSYLRFSDDGNYLFSSSNNELLTKWNHETKVSTSTNKPVGGYRNKAIFIGHEAEFILAESNDYEVVFWDITDIDTIPEPQKFLGHQSRVWSITISPDRKWIASSDEHGTTIIFDLEKKEMLYTISLDRPYERMNITGVKGLNPAEYSALQSLGATIDDD